jgi:phage terminase large subunit GpA-like protein
MATAFYRDHRAELDEGGSVSWEDDKPEEFISALQWCMTIRSLQPDFFRCELQQEGAPPASGLSQLAAKEIVKRLSGIPRGIVPAKSQYLTAFVDSGDHVLWWMVVAWQKDFTGWIVDYGTWPDQGRKEFYKSELARTLEEKLPGRSWEEAFVHAHNCLDEFMLRDWPAQDGQPRQVDLMLKDGRDGDHMKLIQSQVSLSKNQNRIRTALGFGPKPGKKPVHFYGDKDTDRHTFAHWVERRKMVPMMVNHDSKKFKSLAARRLDTVSGAPSSILLPGSDGFDHNLISEHFTAEKAKTESYDGFDGVLWEAIPGRDNDWWDCLVGNCVAASMLGACVPGTEVKQKERRTFVMPVRR